MTSGKRALTAVSLIAVLTAVALSARDAPQSSGVAAGGPVTDGRVVDENGAAIAHAAVDLGADAVVDSDDEGRFSAVLLGGPRLVTASADGYLSRTQALEPGTATEIILTSQAAATVSLRFGGDVMFGRRYFDRNDDGDRSDGLLPTGASVEDHAALLSHVRPLLEDADLTVVNLETPLVSEPWVNPTAPRPARFHPTKEFVFASAPESVQALLDSGVDVVSLGNNHVFDALAEGMDSTLAALDSAGLPHFGAGRTIDEAWAPALIDRKGQRLAFIGCTTITGTEHVIAYVADFMRGGAARCTTDRLRQEVSAARALADTVVVMVHGGEEYEQEQTEVVRGLTRVAVQAGAALVVNGHPHVLGGVTVEGQSVVAETMGNLLFDQTVWPTFLSYLLRVDLRASAPVLATVDPLLLEDYVPRPTVGVVADAAARRAAGVLPGPMRLRQPGAVLTLGRLPPEQRTSQELLAGTLARLAPGFWIDAPPPESSAQVALGEDLLWTGSFEDMDTDPATPGAHQWAFGSNVELSAEAVCSGGLGMALRRSPVSDEDVVLTPTHRQLARPGALLSLLVDVRSASPGGSLELALYGDTKGPSFSTLRVPIPPGENGPGSCRRVRLDTVLLPGTVAVQPFVRLVAPPGDLLAAHLEVDDVRLIAWAPTGSSGRRYDTVEARGDLTLELVNDREGDPQSPFVEAPATPGVSDPD